MKPLYLRKLAIITSILLAISSGSFAQTTAFNTPGGPYTYTVGPGVTAIGLDMAGGQGGTSQSSNGGKGGRIQCTIAVTPGQVLNVYVGGAGQNHTNTGSQAGGANGGGNGYGYGGGGGGESDIRIGGTAYSNVVAVAAGGGGGGYDCGTTNGEYGGDGGGSTGGNGTYCGGSYYAGYCGAGASASANGVGANCCGVASAGTQGQGGSATSASYPYGGGGGAGYYSGGAGTYGGGGGGVSYPASGVTAGVVSGVNNTSGFNAAAGYVNICAPNLGIIVGNNPVCAGSTMTLSSTGSGGTWTSGATTVATITSTGIVTGVAAGVAVMTYSASVAGCGSGFITAVVTVNPLPTSIIGTASACVGLTSTLSDAGGGTWSTSDATLASVNSVTGLVTGISAGTPTITYTLPVTGCKITTPFVVFPLPANIVGPSTVCAAGGTVVMTDVTPSGTWSTANPATATVTGGSGIVTGGAAGVTNITYTLPSGCTSTFTITVNALPSSITGAGNVCTGSTTTLSDVGGGSWSSSNVSIASVGPTGIVSGVSAGTANITYTLGTGCSISTPMLVNPLPAAIGGTLAFCNGGSSTLTDASTGGTWASSNATLATVVPSSGLVSSVSSGIPNITYTLPTGCYTVAAVSINALPNAFLVTGGGPFCAGSGGVHIGLGLSSTGVNYKLYNGPTLVTTVGGSNSALDFGVYSAAGTYTVVGINSATGCTSNMAGSTTISINPLPSTYNVTGGGSFCPGGAGVHVTQSGSAMGINYQLVLGGVPTGAAVAGTGSSLDFGALTSPGVYTVQAINPTTGCSAAMIGSASITLNSLPPIHTVTGGGSFCSGGTGVAIGLDGSDPSTTYQLFYGTSISGAAMAGTGSAINYGLHTGAGSYTIVATSTVTGCSSNMSGVATIAINPLPLVFFVTGGGGYCPGGAGAHVNLNYSTTGINYQLYLGSSPVGSLVAGSNAGLDFGLQTTAGTYSVVAIDAATGCTKNMSGTANVFINPLPVNHNVTGGGNYCVGGSGEHVGLNGSNAGITYQLLFGGVPSGTPISGTGTSLDFGLKTATGNYTVVATNATTSCSVAMSGTATIGVNSLPNIDTVEAGGTGYCAGGAGVDISLSGSDMGINYQLFRGGAASGSPMPGTGTAIDFGMVTGAGLYTIVATNPVTGCQATMQGSAPIAVSPAPSVYVVTGGGHYCAGGTGVNIGLSGSTLGVNYQLNLGGSGTGLPVSGTGSTISFGTQSATGSYTVTAIDAISGCSATMYGSPSVTVTSLPLAYTVTGTGSYCAGGTGLDVYLSSSTAGVHYQLYNGSTPVGTYTSGSGSLINFGLHLSGSYTVMATDPSTSCTNLMTGTANITANALPVAQTVTGGGAYCSGGAGSDVSLANSTPGVNYTLIYAGTPAAGAMSGTGAAIDFGMQTGAGTYTVKAVDTTTLCSATMSGSAVISITPQPAVETVTGGGAYCAGGTGVTIGLSGSNLGIQYQLMSGGVSIGSLVAGTGGTISFGSITAPGTYNVIASPGGLCQTGMTGSVTVVASPLPSLHNVTGGGNYCASDSGRVVGLDGSNSGIHYQLYEGSTPVGSFMAGSGSSLNFGLQMPSGIYTVQGTDAVTGCHRAMTGSVVINAIPVPPVFNVTGGGPYCTGGNGVPVALNGSSTNVNYQLMQGSSPVGTPMAGTGTSLNFGLQTVAGNYTVTGTDASSSCTSRMADTAVVSILPISTPVVTIATHPGLTIKMGQTDTLIATVTGGGTSGPLYQWKINSIAVAGATNSMFISNQFHNGDTVSCYATSTGMCGDVTTGKSVVLTVLNTVYVNPVAGFSNVQVVPNPNKGIFTLSGSLGNSDNEEVAVQVTDMTGHTVYAEKIMSVNGSINNRIQLNGSVANGMYLLTLRSNSASQVFHIVVEQ